MYIELVRYHVRGGDWPAARGNRGLRQVMQDRRTLTLDDLTETEVGDWKMPTFKMACTYAVSQGWLLVEDDVLTLTTAELAAA
jgi:hypothetical protein